MQSEECYCEVGIGGARCGPCARDTEIEAGWQRRRAEDATMRADVLEARVREFEGEVRRLTAELVETVERAEEVAVES